MCDQPAIRGTGNECGPAGAHNWQESGTRKKVGWGYRYEPDKFGIAGLTPIPSLDVQAPRIAECPVQMEGVVHEMRPFGKNVSANAFEVHIVRLHVEESLLVGDESRPHIDPEKWQPLIMTFCRFFGIGREVHSSRLAGSNFMNFVKSGTEPGVTEPAGSR